MSVPPALAAVELPSFAKKMLGARKLLSCTPERMLFISGTPLPCAAGLILTKAIDTALRGEGTLKVRLMQTEGRCGLVRTCENDHHDKPDGIFSPISLKIGFGEEEAHCIQQAGAL